MNKNRLFTKDKSQADKFREAAEKSKPTTTKSGSMSG